MALCQESQSHLDCRTHNNAYLSEMLGKCEQKELRLVIRIFHVTAQRYMRLSRRTDDETLKVKSISWEEGYKAETKTIKEIYTPEQSKSDPVIFSSFTEDAIYLWERDT